MRRFASSWVRQVGRLRGTKATPGAKAAEKGQCGFTEWRSSPDPRAKRSSNTVGQDHVLRGWWKPDRYPELRYVGRESLQRWLAV